jgi:hypothetical protein
MDDYERLYQFNTEFYTSYDAKIIEEKFVNYLRRKEMSYAFTPTKYKLKFNDFLDDPQKQVEICMKILKVNDEINCIEFKMVKGIKEDFKKLYQIYKE